jgi:hypothetical protein
MTNIFQFLGDLRNVGSSLVKTSDGRRTSSNLIENNIKYYYGRKLNWEPQQGLKGSNMSGLVRTGSENSNNPRTPNRTGGSVRFLGTR